MNTCRRIKLIVFLLIVFVSLCGCKTINKLRTAQDTFNEAASLDNQSSQVSYYNNVTPSEVSAAPIAPQDKSKLLYHETLEILDTIDDSGKTTLKKNKLYGNYLILKGLSYWKLDKNAEATAVVAEAEKETDNLIDRDKKLFEIMPSLIALNEAKPYYVKSTKHLDENCFNIKRITEIITDEEIEPFDKILNDRNENSNLRLYVAQCKLLAYFYQHKGYRFAASNKNSTCAATYINRFNAADSAAKQTIKELETIIKDISNAKGIVPKWKHKFNFK